MLSLLTFGLLLEHCRSPPVADTDLPRLRRFGSCQMAYWMAITHEYVIRVTHAKTAGR
jgi:hypothetical protein